MSSVQELTDINFIDEIKKSEFAIVDFWAPWCNPCINFAPIFSELSEEMSDKIKFFKINIEEYTEKASKYRVQSIPTLIVFKDGGEISTKVGSHSKEDVKSFIESAISQ